MNRIIVGLLVLHFISFSLHAQSYTTQYRDSSTGWHQSAGGELNVYNKITNTAQGPIWIKWRITANNISAGWIFKGFCDNMLCYGGTAPGLLDGAASQVSFPYVPNQPGDFHAIFDGDAAPNNSAAWIEVLAEDTINNDSKKLTFIARKGPLSIAQVRETQAINVFPNPAQDYINIFHGESQKVKEIEMLSAAGIRIGLFEVSCNRTKLPLDQLTPGIYLLRLKAGDGHVMYTASFSHY